ncbi:MAG: hypothetical protein JK586_10720 [Nocardiopsis sp. BM-2018]|nr:MAG: hypothetical protein JK586_10720 [Nocardiopsis sp. BM-2018]
MGRSYSSLGFLGMFGRSHDLKQLDAALRAVDLHPNVVPEAIKLTIVNLLKDHAIGKHPAPQAYAPAAEIVAYCMLGPAALAASNPPELIDRTEARIERALEDGDSLDAQLVLLTLHAKVCQPAVIERYGLESG